jgi:DNA-binding MarR family transcriptional regulator
LKPLAKSANLCAGAVRLNTQQGGDVSKSTSTSGADAGAQAARPLVEQFAHVVRAYTSALQGVTLAAAAQMGINTTDHRCLELIERSGGLTAGQLAELSGLSTGAVTTVLDRLERVGYVRRTRDSSDRRRVLVEVTPQGHAIGHEIFGPLIADSRAMLAGFSDEQLAFLIDFLNRGRDLSLAHTARIRALGPAHAPVSTPTPDE